MKKDSVVQPKLKRRKLDGDTPAITIASARDLRHLLTPQRNSPSGVKTAVQQFKDFLGDVTGTEKDGDPTKKLQILKEYSEEQISSNQQAVAFPDLISIWSSAVETNNESILSSLPSLLALYLKTISSHLQFRDIGLSLCRGLLLKDQLRLLDRGLTATKTKEHLIAPCLRLLTEIVSFDGGEVATLVYSKRDTTFRRLEVFLFLDQRTSIVNRKDEAQQKPALRRIAQRYLLANLKFQSPSAKGDIIAQGKILRSCLQNLRNDQADVIADVLVGLENDIVRVKSVSKGVKSRLFTNSNLSSLLALYSFHESANEVPPGSSIRDRVNSLLRIICMQEESGVLFPQNGWYPPGRNSDMAFTVAADASRIDLGIGSSVNHDKREKYSVRNGVLSTFILGLKPELDRLQASLLLDIFRAAPELVANYFSKKSNFIAEPKDTPAWLGQSAFLFSVIQLPVPARCGWKDVYALLPPPSSAVIESILPRPLDRQNTTRSLCLNHEVITLFAVRAVTVAFQKLRKVLDVYHSATFNLESWKQAASELLSAFSQRCPLAKDVMSTFSRTPKSDEQLRGAIIDLLAKYYEFLPHLVLLEKYDTSLALVDAIERVGSDVGELPLRSSRFSELENLLKIARMSPDTKWWQKPDSLQHSAFTSMLKAILEADQSIPAIPPIRHLLRTIAAEDGVLLDDLQYFDALVTSLTGENGWTPSARIISFFDNCACRIARQPVHYEDLVEGTNANVAAICLLPYCIAEQWPFVIGIEDRDDQKEIAEWIARFLVHLIRAGEEAEMIDALHCQIVSSTSDAALKKDLKKAYQRRTEESLPQVRSRGLKRVTRESHMTSVHGAASPHVAPKRALEPQYRAMESMEGLERLNHEDLEAVVGNGRLGRLCKSLSSLVEETRRQGFVTLQGVMKQIELSTYSDKGPLFILIGELTETAKSVGLAGPLPSVLTEFAAGAVDLLNQPSHPIYGKLNKFLQKGPSWNVCKFLAFSVEKILLREPEDDNGQSHEIAWLLNLLIRGLQNDQDMEVYRKSNVFDRLPALYRSPLCSETDRRQILKLIECSIRLGGGMTLITRVGIESWVAIERADGKDQEMIKELESELYQGVDAAAVQHWKFPTTLDMGRLTVPQS